MKMAWDLLSIGISCLGYFVYANPAYFTGKIGPRIEYTDEGGQPREVAFYVAALIFVLLALIFMILCPVAPPLVGLHLVWKLTSCWFPGP